MEAYNKEGEIWSLNPRIGPVVGKKVLHLYGPCSYYIDSLLERLEGEERTEICIDMGGRVFGSSSSVYVGVEDIKEYLKSQGEVWVGQ